MSAPVNQTTSLPFEPLTREYAGCNEAAMLEHTEARKRTVTNRQGDTVILTSTLLIEHMQWAYAHTDPQGPGE